MRLHKTLIAIVMFAILLFAMVQSSDAHRVGNCYRYAKKIHDGGGVEAWRANVSKCKRHNRAHVCQKSIRVKHVRANPHQRMVIRTAYQTGKRLGITNQTIYVSIFAALTQESSATELNHGDGTSIGPLQLIDEHYGGSFSKRKSTYWSSLWYYNGARKKFSPGIAPGDLSQRVQGSAHPTLYHQWVPEARRTLSCMRVAYG